MDDPRIARTAAAALAAALALLAGCQPRITDTHLASPYPRAQVVAVAPFINLSGSPHVDPLAVSDIFFAEVQMVEGFRVLPLNRSLQAMSAMNMASLDGPADALKLAEFLGADLIFVGAITAYDPYQPPQVGLAVQLYARRGGGGAGGAGLDPIALERSGRALPIDPGSGDPLRPRAQVSEVFNAGHEIVQKQMRQYAEIRQGETAPLGWKLYSKSIQHYMRFCCWRSICEILDQEQARIWMTTPRPTSAGRGAS